MNKEQIPEKEIEKVSGGEISKDMLNDPKWKTTVHAVCMKCGKWITRTYYTGPGYSGVIKERVFPGEVRCDECRKKEWEEKWPSMTKVGSEETKQ